ncbi:MAG: hypothetical protein R3B09_07520 [Nannocystaceae bacterium]
MSILIRAIITGFGLKLGGDIYRLVNNKLGVFPEDEGTSQDDEIEDAKARILTILGGL